MANNLVFVETPNPGKKTKMWAIYPVRLPRTSEHALACVGYYPQWRRYVVSPFAGKIFDASCLREIADFLDEHKEDRQ